MEQIIVNIISFVVGGISGFVASLFYLKKKAEKQAKEQMDQLQDMFGDM